MTARAQEVSPSDPLTGQATAAGCGLRQHCLIASSFVNPETSKLSSSAAAFARLAVGLCWPPEGEAPMVPPR
eukprot:3592594-Pyramimonas_sp.AAC.1